MCVTGACFSSVRARPSTVAGVTEVVPSARLRPLATRLGAHGPGPRPRGRDAVNRASLCVTAARLSGVRAGLAAVPGIHKAAATLLGTATARLGARGPIAWEGAQRAVNRAGKCVTNPRLFEVRANVAAILGGFGHGAAARLRAATTRLGAPGPGGESARGTVHRARATSTAAILVVGRAALAAVPGLPERARAALGATTTRLGAGVVAAPVADNTVYWTRMGIAALRLGASGTGVAAA